MIVIYFDPLEVRGRDSRQGRCCKGLLEPMVGVLVPSGEVLWGLLPPVLGRRWMIPSRLGSILGRPGIISGRRWTGFEPS